MRKYVLCACVILCVVLLTACSAFQVEFRDEYGRALDRPYGPQKVITTTPFIQNYDGWVAISVDGSPAITVPYGENFPAHMVSQKHFSYEIFWEEQIGYDGVLQKVRHSRTGLYSGKPIVIDELFLRNWVRLKFVVSNNGIETADYGSSQGHVFTLLPGQDIVLDVIAGYFELSWRPHDKSYSGESLRGCKTLRPGKKILWKDTIYDDGTITRRVRPNWSDHRTIRRGDCIPL